MPDDRADRSGSAKDFIRLKGLVPTENGSAQFLYFKGEKTEGFDSDSIGQISRMALLCPEEFREDLETVFQYISE